MFEPPKKNQEKKKHFPLHSILIVVKWKSETELTKALQTPSFQAALSNLITQATMNGAKTDQEIQK